MSAVRQTRERIPAAAALGNTRSSLSLSSSCIMHNAQIAEHTTYGFPQKEQAYINGKGLNPPRVHDFDEETKIFDEEFRKESQIVVYVGGGWSKRYAFFNALD